MMSMVRSCGKVERPFEGRIAITFKLCHKRSLKLQLKCTKQCCDNYLGKRLTTYTVLLLSIWFFFEKLQNQN